MPEPSVQLLPSMTQQFVLHALVLLQRRGKPWRGRGQHVVFDVLLKFLAAAIDDVVLALVVGLVEDDILEAGAGQRRKVKHDQEGDNGSGHWGSHR